jgi:hypothetical protein
MGTVLVPERSAAQRLDALQKANRTRVYRSRLKQRIKAGQVDAPSVLAANDDPLLYTMRVSDLLLAIPKYGPDKVRRLLRGCGVSPSKTLDGLTGRQRQDLVRGLYGQPPAR